MELSKYEKEIRQIPLLSKEETEELIILAQSGDEEARNKLIEHNLRLVLQRIARLKLWLNPPFSTEDLISVGSYGIIRAINNYVKTKGKFSTLMVLCIDNALKAYVYNWGREKRNYVYDISLQALLDPNAEDGEGLTLEDFLKTDDVLFDEGLISGDLKFLLKELLDKLPEKQRYVLIQRYFYARTLQEIGDELSLTREGVRQIEIKALNKMRVSGGKRGLKLFLG